MKSSKTANPSNPIEVCSRYIGPRMAMVFFIFMGMLSSCQALGNQSPGGMASEEPGSVEDLRPVPALAKETRDDLGEKERQQFDEAYARVQSMVIEEANAAGIGKEQGDLGLLLLAYDFDEEAEPALENARMLLPNDLKWSYYLGYLKLRGDRFEEAIADFERVLKIEPDNPIANVRMAAAQREIGDLESASVFLQVALLNDPEMAHAYAQLGEVLGELGDTEKAIVMLQKALELQPTATSLYYVLGRMFQEMGNEKRAAELIAQRGEAPTAVRDPFLIEVERLKQSESALLNRASQLMNLGRFREAVPAYRAAIEAEPGNADAYVGLAGALMLTNDMRGGLEAIEKAIELDPTNSQAHFNMGSFKERLGNYQGAAEEYELALKHDPDNEDAPRQLGMMLRRLRRCDDAAVYLKQALDREPSDHPVRLQLALCLRQVGRDAEALELIEGASEAYPTEIMYQDGLARLLASADDDAVRDGARALEMAEEMVKQGKTIEKMDVLAMAYAETGDFELAMRAVDDAISLAKAQRSPAILMDHLESNRARYLEGKPSRTTWPGFLIDQ
jgi:tetratricopeptide (TPR) repeat protein